MGTKVKEFWNKHQRTIKYIGAIASVLFVGTACLKKVINNDEYNALIMD